MEAVAWGIFRDRESIMEMACSPVVIVLPPGVFMTTIPRLLAAVMSTLSRPAPARPMIFRFSALSMIACVTFVALRITRPSYSLMTPFSSSGVRFVMTSTSIPGVLFNTLIPSADRESLISTFFMQWISFSDFLFCYSVAFWRYTFSNSVRAALMSAGSIVGPHQKRKPGGASL